MTTPQGEPRKPRIVILTPVYNEEANLEQYVRAVQGALLSQENCAYEVLFVDDGSTDRSWALICSICENDPRFRAIRLSRNFGSHIALSAGIDEAEGDAVATLACDLQDPPETILRFTEEWLAGAQIVWGVRESRDESWWRILASNLFFHLLRRFAMPAGSRFSTGSFLLVDRVIADCLRRFREHNRITFALVAWTGFDQATVSYARRNRTRGKSRWSFGRMMRAMYDAFIGFSTLPIKLMILVSLATFLVALSGFAYTLVAWASGDPLPGWTSIMLVVSLGFGIQFFLMSVMGEYLSRIHGEVVSRPLYFVSGRAGPPRKRGNGGG